MFTGIVESMGEVTELVSEGSNLRISIRSEISDQLKIDQSVSHNGVCLTVVQVAGDVHQVVAVEETLSRSSLGALRVGSRVNLERCLKADGRFDGHIVQGHVDTMGRCSNIEERDGSWLFTFDCPQENENLFVEKGSICVNGISLTCFDTTENQFKVAIIPYTYEHTTMKELNEGDPVNLEFDIVGKYVQKLLG